MHAKLQLNASKSAGKHAARPWVLQVMEEIIAKSKMYKAIKAKQREEDEDELDKVRRV